MPGPHVALNATFLDPGVSGGPESYIRGLIPALAEVRPDARLTVLTSRRGAAQLAADGWTSFATVVAMPCDEGSRARRLYVETAGVPRWAARHRPTLLHSLASIGPATRTAVPHVLTLHDLTFMRVPTFSRATTVAMTQIALRGARHASRIITAAGASRAELEELGGIDPAKVDIVPHGRRPLDDADPAVMAALGDRLGLDGRRVVVNVAAQRPHKNQELLVRALEHLPADVVVVLAGRAEPYADELRALAPQLGVEDRLIMPGYLDDDELEALWRLADAAAFPTRGEGFGLPVIEALDRGLPVACSDIDVLTEVSGGLAHPFGVDDPAGAARAIEAALTDGKAAADERHAYAAQFTWQRAAELTWDSYERGLAAAR
ncbi:MAG: glycosyltransferase family 4 protein [Solirubrobacteraceae bacterium]|nr:glycosyltransferase family 4 protein [Solirubrobacteraceae bacterium]